MYVRKLLSQHREGSEVTRDSMFNWAKKNQQTLNPYMLTPSKPGSQPLSALNGDSPLSTGLPEDVGYVARLSCTGRQQ